MGHNSDDRGEISASAITDKTLEINLLYSSNINPKVYAHYNQQQQDK